MFRLSFSLMLLAPLVAIGQEEPLKAQKAAAADNIKQANLGKLAEVETDNILLFTTLPDAKAKLLADAAQKAFASSVKLLKVEEKTPLWAGKLTAYVLPTRTNYNSFVRLVLKDRPEAIESHRVNSTTDTPFVLVGVEPGTTSTDASLAEELSQTVARVALARKVGTRTTTTQLPYWLSDGFSKLAAMRAEGSTAKLNAFKTRQRAVFGKQRVNTFKAGSVWGTDKIKDQDVLSVSFVEYLLFAPEPKFDKFVNAFKPGEGQNGPVSTDTALAALEWTDEAMLDTAWKTWIVKSFAK